MKTTLLNVFDLQPSTVQQIRYKEIKDEDMWRIPIIQEALDMKYGDINPLMAGLQRNLMKSWNLLAQSSHLLLPLQLFFVQLVPP